MKKIGVILIVVGTIMWGIVFAVPFFPISTSAKIILGIILTVNGEVFFWFGTGIIGRDLIKKWINPKKWFKKDEKLEKGENE